MAHFLLNIHFKQRLSNLPEFRFHRCRCRRFLPRSRSRSSNRCCRRDSPSRSSPPSSSSRPTSNLLCPRQLRPQMTKKISSASYISMVKMGVWGPGGVYHPGKFRGFNLQKISAVLNKSQESIKIIVKKINFL